MKKQVSGFTLIEILVVLVIITVLVSVVGLNILRKPGEARVAKAKIEINQFKTVLKIYYTEQGRYPTQEQGLEALVEKPVTGPAVDHYPADGYLDTRYTECRI